MFVGAGAAVMGRSPLIELIPIVNLHIDFWIMGSCEPFVEAWIRGPIKFYAPLQGCELREEVRTAIFMYVVAVESRRRSLLSSLGPSICLLIIHNL